MNLASAVHHEISALQPDVAFSRTSALEDYLSASAAPRRFNMVLVGLFGVTALMLAVIGVYGVISDSVSRRTREFGLRFALGASHRDVLGVVMARAGRLVGTGLLLGLIGAFCATRALRGLLFQVQPFDPKTFLIVVGVVAAVGLFACIIPARRAAKVDPMVALRSE
jgi:putative ABC transport system permease protein